MKTKNEEWTKFEVDNKFLFVAVVTHEVRSSANNEVFAPFAKLGAGTMYIAGVKNSSRLQALNYVIRAGANNHLTYEQFFYKNVSELMFKCPENSTFGIDGEVHKSKDFNVTLLPGTVTYLGKTNHVNSF